MLRKFMPGLRTFEECIHQPNFDNYELYFVILHSAGI